MDPELKSALLALLSRKFLASMFGVFIVAFVLHLDDQTKVQFITWIIGIFSATNVAQKIGTPQSKIVTTEKTESPMGATTEKTTS